MVEFLFGVAVAILIVLVAMLFFSKVKKYLDGLFSSQMVSIDNISIVSKVFAMIGLLSKQGINKSLSEAISKSPAVSEAVDVKIDYVRLEIDRKIKELVKGFDSSSVFLAFPFLGEPDTYIVCDAVKIEKGKYLLDYKTFFKQNNFLFSLEVSITYKEPSSPLKTAGDLYMKVYNPSILVGDASRSLFKPLDKVNFNGLNNMPLPFDGVVSEHVKKITTNDGV